MKPLLSGGVIAASQKRHLLQMHTAPSNAMNYNRFSTDNAVRPDRRRSLIVAAGLVLLGGGAASAQTSVNVPNGSFESPSTTFVTTIIDSWQKAPQPDYFASVASTYGFTWDQTAGLFLNTPSGASDHIDNVDGSQSAYLLAFPSVSLSQNLTTTYQVGVSYALTVGVLGKGLTDGDFLSLSFSYTDASNNQVQIAKTTVTYSAAGLPSTTHLTDFQVDLPSVQAGDAWAGKQIGVQVTSVYGDGNGYWDVDNVRVSAVPEPQSLVVVAAFGLLGFAAWRRLGASRRSCS